MQYLNSHKGFSLIEALIYIALFALVIGGGVTASYQIFEGSAQIKQHNITEAEANFLARKLDWALNDSTVSTPSVNTLGDEFEVTKDGDTYEFALVDGAVELNGVVLSSDSVVISDLVFHRVGALNGKPESLSFSFSVDGRAVGTTTRYVR